MAPWSMTSRSGKSFEIGTEIYSEKLKHSEVNYYNLEDNYLLSRERERSHLTSPIVTRTLANK